MGCSQTNYQDVLRNCSNLSYAKKGDAKDLSVKQWSFNVKFVNVYPKWNEKLFPPPLLYPPPPESELKLKN